jgi:hypothetical protein
LQAGPAKMRNAAIAPKRLHLKICFRVMRTPFLEI